MNLTPDGKIYIQILLASAFFSISAVAFGFFPYLSISLSFIFFTLIAYRVKKVKTPQTKILLAITLVLSSFLVIRSEVFLTFLNVFSIFYFGILMVLSDKKLYNSLVAIAFSPISFLTSSMLAKSKYHLEYSNAASKDVSKDKTIHTVVILVLTIAILAIIIPLLSWANPIFEKMVINVLNFLGLSNIKISESIFQWLIRIIIFLGLSILVPKMATQLNKDIPQLQLPSINLNMLLPKIAVTFVLIIFFITQLQLYFSTNETLKNLGYTHSQYAREVFAQLSAVSVVIIAILLNDKGRKRYDKIFTYSLLLSGFFLTLISYKSVFDYSNAWGFTYKRLYGFTVATWLSGVYILYFYTYKKALQTSFFIYSSIILTGILLIAVNLANFDYIIYHFKKSATGSGIDHVYLTSLSADSLSYKDQFENLDKIIKYPIPENYSPEYNKYRADNLLRKIEYLQLKYKKMNLGGFNLFEYLAYYQVKDVDIKPARDQLMLKDTR